MRPTSPDAEEMSREDVLESVLAEVADRLREYYESIEDEARQRPYDSSDVSDGTFDTDLSGEDEPRSPPSESREG